MSRTSFFLAGLFWLVSALNKSPFATEVHVAREQPVPFSHKHHVDGLGIDCRFCHTSVETSSFAGIPPTSTCMKCHSVVWKEAPLLEPVRESWKNKKPIAWTRVHDLPDHVYFDHSIHVAKGIGCVSCHGAVDRMPLIRKSESLQMEWCLDCHRNPERYVRPRSEVFDLNWEEPENVVELRSQLVDEYQVASMISCSTCHR